MKIPPTPLRLACYLILLPTLFFLGDAGSQEIPSQAEKSAQRDDTKSRPAKDKADFIQKMVAKHGFGKEELEATFIQVRYSKEAIQLIKPAPTGKVKNWQAYRARFIEPVRIKAGAAFWDKYEDDLARAEKEYGVPAEIIVGIIGVESVYGRNTGDFRIMDVLTTLSFDYPDLPKRAMRMAFFRAELENTLLYAREYHLDPLSLLGSYAGAIGWAQFMPGSIRQFGVDFDGDGKIDLRKSPQDAIGSVANYLARHGWKRGDPIVFPVSLDVIQKKRLDHLLSQGLEAKFSPAELHADNVRSRFTLPSDLKFGLIDLQNGAEPTEYWLGTNNFFAITKYNRSYFYAMSVVELGKAVRTTRNAIAQ